MGPSWQVTAVSPLALLTNTVGGWVEDISNISSPVLLLFLDAEAFLLVLGWEDCGGNAETVLCDDLDESPTVREEPSLANTMGISSRDSAESEWYSAGGAAACTGPRAGARGGREALRGNAAKGIL